MKDFNWAKKETKEVEGEPERRKSLEEKNPHPSFVEVVENRIYFYSNIETEKILQLNRNIRSMGINLQREATIQNREPAKIGRASCRERV